ncbi:MAG TPA: hypothetical protein RMG48_07270 [Myxococcales bacterium LLY-WYZ-16_1]|nr:hypothetical protein [Myxococcales bacterium LLY-WYZ-16_1]
MKTASRCALLGAVTLAVAACGDGAEPSSTNVSAQIAVPEARKARVTVTPALDLSGLADAELSEELTVEQLVVHLVDARLLGNDPRIPAGGLPLLDAPRLVYAEGDGRFGIELPFPSAFLEANDLAVYLRTAPSPELDGAAVRVVASVPEAGQFALVGMVDPEGDPVRPDDGMVDPEGDPVQPDDGMVDPEGDPVHCTEPCDQQSQSLEAGTQIILVDRAGTELVVSFDERSHFDVVFGIRAANWLNPESQTGPAANAEPVDGADAGHEAGALEGTVIEADRRSHSSGDLPRKDEDSSGNDLEGGTYFLGDGLWTQGGILGGPGGGL